MDHTMPLTIARLIQDNPGNVARRLALLDGVSRQTASKQLAELKRAGMIAAEGVGRGTRYRLVEIAGGDRHYPTSSLSEERVWSELCDPVLHGLPANIRRIWHHGLTEMINNAIDHSGADQLRVQLSRNILGTMARVTDPGVGVFRKIRHAFNLQDDRDAILELAKGKCTTDPERHTGEGIFFSSKMFDQFSLHSGALFYLYDNDKSDPADILVEAGRDDAGTTVFMRLANDSTRTSKEIFDQFALPEDYVFARTVVPVRLAQRGNDMLVSRSEAKRLTRHFDRFQCVILDFSGVTDIGQGFADEVFRVFRNAHPALVITPIRASAAVAAMIARVSKES